METASPGDGTVKRPRPRGVVRLVARLPVLAYRLRLGRLLGGRFILVRHRGRKTGKLRQTVLEVVRFDRERCEYIVVSAWGETADWFRNIERQPAVEVQTGRERFRPRQRFLDFDERLAELESYAREHPSAARTIGRWLGVPFDGSPEATASLARSVRMVAFRRTCQDEGADQASFQRSTAATTRP
ncbi:MAG: nitroreductase family deazaflavin-dependent oxidoreductase [Thermoflexaceae bacterium]|nr:nitroreductase family deazaflavin-dependent oxidoreductase [Thermoflexaceae bacterium]